MFSQKWLAALGSVKKTTRKQKNRFTEVAYMRVFCEALNVSVRQLFHRSGLFRGLL